MNFVFSPLNWICRKGLVTMEEEVGCLVSTTVQIVVLSCFSAPVNNLSFVTFLVPCNTPPKSNVLCR